MKKYAALCFAIGLSLVLSCAKADAPAKAKADTPVAVDDQLTLEPTGVSLDASAIQAMVAVVNDVLVNDLAAPHQEFVDGFQQALNEYDEIPYSIDVVISNLHAYLLAFIQNEKGHLSAAAGQKAVHQMMKIVRIRVEKQIPVLSEDEARAAQTQLDLLQDGVMAAVDDASVELRKDTHMDAVLSVKKKQIAHLIESGRTSLTSPFFVSSPSNVNDESVAALLEDFTNAVDKVLNTSEPMERILVHDSACDFGVVIEPEPIRRLNRILALDCIFRILYMEHLDRETLNPPSASSKDWMRKNADVLSRLDEAIQGEIIRSGTESEAERRRIEQAAEKVMESNRLSREN
ncbi:MAG: hypothetical protein GC154_14780 [bacterium]|nr:hypothetical protein [bacterium]